MMILRWVEGHNGVCLDNGMQLETVVSAISSKQYLLMVDLFSCLKF